MKADRSSAAFFLGRYRAGILAVFCVITTSLVTAFNFAGFASFDSPLVIGLTLVIWGAVLGLTAMLVGTLSDERNSRIVELHEAYVGVVEVLSKYLQSADPLQKEQSIRIAQLCREVALQLRLTPSEVDDIRVASLLHDIENIEVTSRVLRKAVGKLENDEREQHTFHGTDLVNSLGSVLTGALPLLIQQTDALEDNDPANDPQKTDVALGTKIICAVRAYVAFQEGEYGPQFDSPAEAIDQLRNDSHIAYDSLVLNTLERVLANGSARAINEPLEVVS